jgi:hypothetical protein
MDSWILLNIIIIGVVVVVVVGGGVVVVVVVVVVITTVTIACNVLSNTGLKVSKKIKTELQPNIYTLPCTNI